ncbi:MAG: DUF3833 family protein [Gemmatimonadaceae bacterium]
MSLRHLPLLGCLVLSACLRSLPARPPVQPQPTFDPIAFFSGRTVGEGTLSQRFGGARRVAVEGVGTSSADGSFTLDQTITFGDSTTEKRRWVMRRTDATHFAATLSDARGNVTAEVNGNSFHLRYLIREPRVTMDQWLFLQPDGRSVLNQAEVTVLGVPWAHLSETITRAGAG